MVKREKISNNGYFLILNREGKFDWFENPDNLVAKVIGRKLSVACEVVQKEAGAGKQETFIIHTLQPIEDDAISNVIKALEAGGLGKFQVSQTGAKG